MELLMWSANKLASEGAPQAAAMKAQAEEAVAAFEALKQAQETGQAPSTPAMPAPSAQAAAVPAPAPPAPAPPAPVGAAQSAAVSQADLEAARKNMELLVWSAEKLASEGAPQAAAMKVKADQAEAAFEVLQRAYDSGQAPSAAAPPTVPEPAAVEQAPAAAPTVSQDDVERARKKAEYFSWSASQLASAGSPELAEEMRVKADQAVRLAVALVAR